MTAYQKLKIAHEIYKGNIPDHECTLEEKAECEGCQIIHEAIIAVAHIKNEIKNEQHGK